MNLTAKLTGAQYVRPDKRVVICDNHKDIKMFNCTENKGNKLSIEMDGDEAIITIASAEMGCNLVVCLSKEDGQKLKADLPDKDESAVNMEKQKVIFSITPDATLSLSFDPAIVGEKSEERELMTQGDKNLQNFASHIAATVMETLKSG